MVLNLKLLLIISVHICNSIALPPCFCPRNYLAVCGSDGKMYNNDCVLQCAAYRTKTTITIVKPGPCEKSLPEVTLRRICFCPMEESPVCGSDGQTYRNECGLNCHRERFDEFLTVEHSGFCENVLEPPCVCGGYRSPVCGSDGNTYDNDCLLNCASKKNTSLRVAYVGACRDIVQVQDLLLTRSLPHLSFVPFNSQ